MRFLILCIYCVAIFSPIVASMWDYLPIGRSLFNNDNSEPESANEISSQKVPYEVAVVDEKFIEQAAKFTGVSLSELDKCQHRVVLKLQQECNNLNDEDLAKLAVALLNCQSAAEGRKIYPCTDTMSLRECTAKMDSDTWNSYLLMSNRARAVCYSVRQAHFRGLTELTVNKLMSSAQEQLNLMSRLKDGQSKLVKATVDTFDVVVSGTSDLKRQQQDLQKAQFQGQLVLEDNIQRLSHEKKLIMEGHRQLSSMTKDIMAKLEDASEQLDSQASEHKLNHAQVLTDLAEIQKQSQQIFLRIETSTKHMLEQSLLAAKQYESTLIQLAQVNSTIYSLVGVMENTKRGLEEKLAWLTEALGGTDDALDRLYLFLTHASYLLLAMISCAFLQISPACRLALVVLVPLNLFVALQHGRTNALSFAAMTAALMTFFGLHTAFNVALNYWAQHTSKKAMLTYKEKKSPVKEENVSGQKSELHNTFDETEDAANRCTSRSPYMWEQSRAAFLDEFLSPTPPLSRNGLSRSRSNTPSLSRSLYGKTTCAATTRMGTPCKMKAAVGREFCHKHQNGSSVIS